MREKYTITGLDCANCAAKLESKMNEIPEVNEVVLTFATQQLLVDADDLEAAIPALQKLADRAEPGTKIEKLTRRRSASAEKRCCGHHHEHEHEHGEACSCGHHHEYEHEHGEACGCGHHHGHGHEHEHEHGEACGCGHHHEHDHSHGHTPWYKNGEVVSLLAGALLFAAAEITAHLLADSFIVSRVLFVIAYVILGGEIVLTAVKNLFRGKVFDENFLMSIATIGAFIVGEFAEAVGVMLFYRIGELFENIAVNRSRKQIMDAVDMRPEVVRLLKDGGIIEADPEDVKIGDQIEIRPGDRIPLDGIVIRGESRIDTSAVTGEPVPVAVRPGNQVMSGCVNTSGVLYLRVEKLLEDSMVTRILEAVENAAAAKPKMDRFITKFARIYTPFVVLLALCTALIPPFISGNWSHWIYTALSFLIISCPCALVLSVPLAFFAGIGAGSGKGILFKGGASLEMLADIKTVVMDKTGTITEGSFCVESVEAAAGLDAEAVLRLAAAAESVSTHPIAASIREAAQERGAAGSAPDSAEEISGEGMKAELDGIQILCGNQSLLSQYGIVIPERELQESGTEVFLAKDGLYAGRIVLGDKLKEDSKEAIQAMEKKGLYTAMLTGDALRNAEAVQKQTGIHEIFARQMPEDKLKNLQKLRREHGAVMFIGDGINDAPVLAGADVGAAMGSGADAAIEAADVVFMTSRLTALVESYEIARHTKRIARQNVIFALAVKAAVMVLGLCGIASMWMAVFADSGVAMLCVLNSIRLLYKK
ncbi:MAG: cadmium-translocating P-type ATPase [Clostridiaceae bacterium]|nr:cadmium-translocating P-type ATPase [Clostridiaceae bacterium]